MLAYLAVPVNYFPYL